MPWGKMGMNSSIQFQRVSLLIIVSLLVSVALVFAQADEKWKKQNDHGNRYEGRIGIPAGNPPLELLSFVGGSAPLPAGAPPDVALKICFFLPDSSPAFISARELEEEKQYWMEAKQTSWKPQKWNTFTPWPTKDVLRREEIPLSNLGVTVRLGEINKPRFVPAVLFSETALVAVTSYKLHLRPGGTLKRVDYELFDDKRKSIKSASLFGERIAGAPFTLELDARGLAEGWKHLNITGTYKGKDRGPAEEYEFYHKPLQPQSCTLVKGHD